FREGVDAGHTLSLDGGDGWRPHTLQHNLTIHHQIHGLTEVLPESTEVARLLERDQIIDEEVDFGFGHIALVAELLQPECFDCQGTVHRADGRHIEQCYLALPFLVEQFAPALDRASSRLRVVTYRISVVPSGHHDDVTRAQRPRRACGALRMYRGYYNAQVRPTADARKKCRLSALHNDGV